MKSLFIDYLIEQKVFDDWCIKADQDTDAFLERVKPIDWLIAAFNWGPEYQKWYPLSCTWQLIVIQHIEATQHGR